MKPQLEQVTDQWHPAGFPAAYMAGHVCTIKHKVALLQKMLQPKLLLGDAVNAAFRNLKVIPFYSPRLSGHGYRQVPKILLQGVWLRKIGFEIDDRANIITLPKLLIISCTNLEYPQYIEPPKPINVLRAR